MLVPPFPSRIPLLNASLTQEDYAIAYAALQSDLAYHQPAQITRLHQNLQQNWDAPYVASFMGGRAALYAVIQTLELQPGDVVLVPAFTCQCVTNAIKFNGVQVQFVDIELETYGMAAEQLKQAITPHTKAVMIQHSFGLVCRDFESLLQIAREQGLWVIEDCAHATGARYRGQAIGSFGDIAFFSSERSKIVNTIHGGWALTRNAQLGIKLQQVYQSFDDPAPWFNQALLRTLCHAYTQRSSSHQIMPTTSTTPGEYLPQMQPEELNNTFCEVYRWRMSPAVAALLHHQLSLLPLILQRRSAGAAFWQTWAQQQGYVTARPLAEAENTWLRFPVLMTAQHKQEKGLLENQLNVELGVWFTTPMHPYPLDLPDCPQGMQATRACVNFPTWLPS